MPGFAVDLNNPAPVPGPSVPEPVVPGPVGPAGDPAPEAAPQDPEELAPGASGPQTPHEWAGKLRIDLMKVKEAFIQSKLMQQWEADHHFGPIFTHLGSL